MVLTLLRAELLRQTFDVIGTMNQLEARLEDVKTPPECCCNWMCGEWTGEAKEADIGFTGGNPQSLALFIEGKPAARCRGRVFLTSWIDDSSTSPNQRTRTR